MPFATLLIVMAGPATSVNSDRVLSSWKEIAAYLGVSVRTAQSWQERGLPVQRLPGGRSRVTARVADLEQWRTSGNPGPASEVAANSPAHPARRISRRALVVVGVVFSLMLGVAAARAFLHHGVPSSVRIEQHAVVVLDERGRELWRKSFPWLYDPGASLNRLWWIGDRGEGETVVVVAPPVPLEVAGELFCSDATGRELWHFTPGRVVRTGRETFLPPFRVERFLVDHLGRDGAVRIAVSSRHFQNYPDQVALLSMDGRLLREYWHPGYLEELVATDLAGTGSKQLILGGVNNARQQATLVVLDPDRFTGASVEENPSYRFQGFRAGVEERRLFFPRSCMNKLYDSYNSVAFVRPEPGGLGVAVMEEQPPLAPEVEYHLGPDLHLVHLDVSDRFRQEHAALHARGELDHAFTPEEERALGAITSVAGPH